MSKTKRAWLAIVFLLIFANNVRAETIQTKVLNIARAEIGKGETTANNQGPDIDKYFNGTRCWGWCSAFVSWVLYQADITELGYQVSSRSLFNRAKELGWTHNNIPVPSDLMVFWRESKTSWKGHCGIVSRVTEKKIYVIEGNRGKYPAKVAEFEYNRNKKIPRLLGYIRINTPTKK